MEDFVHITILYSSDTFDDILGLTDDGKYVAAILSVGNYNIRYPTKYNSIYINMNNIFYIETLDYNIIPHLRYGSIALYLATILKEGAHIYCKKSIKKIITKYIPLLEHEHTIVHITPSMLSIDSFNIDFTKKCIVQFLGRDIIQKAIKQTTYQCIVITKLNSITTLTRKEFMNDTIFFNIIDYTTP